MSDSAYRLRLGAAGTWEAPARPGVLPAPIASPRAAPADWSTQACFSITDELGHWRGLKGEFDETTMWATEPEFDLLVKFAYDSFLRFGRQDYARAREAVLSRYLECRPPTRCNWPYVDRVCAAVWARMGTPHPVLGSTRVTPRPAGGRDPARSRTAPAEPRRTGERRRAGGRRTVGDPPPSRSRSAGPPPDGRPGRRAARPAPVGAQP